jgi:ornithine carbamoyltransferase
MIACAKVGLDIVTATPRGYEPTAEIVAEGIDIAAKTGSSVKVMKDPFEAVRGADIVYTDVWVSMGQEDERDKRLKDFRDYQINEKLMKNTGKKTLLMHCLPAHRGEEVTDVIDGPNSIIYDQAENRMHMQKAILYTLLAAKR